MIAAIIFFVAALVSSRCQFVVQILPKDQVIEEGQSLSISCTIKPQFVNCINVSKIHFEFGSAVYIPEVLSPRTAQLRLEKATVDQDGQYTCIVPPDAVSNISRCSTASKLILYMVQRVTVLRKPLPTSIERCIIYDWSMAKCLWTTSKTKQLEHGNFENAGHLNYTLSIQEMQLNSSLWRRVDCTVSDNTACIWSISNENYFRSHYKDASGIMRQKLCVRVEVWNQNLPNALASSNPYCFVVHDIVLLDPVEEVISEVGSFSATVRWQKPFVASDFSGLLLSYKVTYRSAWQIEWTKAFSSRTVVELRPLNPNSNYTVRVQAATSSRKEWSSIVEKTFRTLPDVPCRQPSVRPNAFFVCSLNESHRNVIIYWKAISKQDECGPGFTYEVHVTSSAGDYSTSQTTNRWVEVIVNNRASKIDVLSKNAQGLSSMPHRTIEVPVRVNQNNTYQDCDGSSGPLVITAKGNDSVVVIQWETANDSGISQVDFYWCLRHKSHIHVCQDDLNFSTIPVTDGRFQLILARSFHLYNIGFSFTMENRSTNGIHWFNCIYDLSKASNPPENVTVSLPDEFSDRILVTWRPSQCQEERHIVKYVISYCKYSYGSCSPVTEVAVKPSHTSYELTSLNVNSVYFIWIGSESENGRSYQSQVSGMTKNQDSVDSIVVGCSIFIVSILLFLAILLYYNIKNLQKIDVVIPLQKKNTDNASQKNNYVVIRPRDRPSYTDMSIIGNAVGSSGFLYVGGHEVKQEIIKQPPDEKAADLTLGSTETSKDETQTLNYKDVNTESDSADKPPHAKQTLFNEKKYCSQGILDIISQNTGYASPLRVLRILPEIKSKSYPKLTSAKTSHMKSDMPVSPDGMREPLLTKASNSLSDLGSEDDYAAVHASSLADVKETLISSISEDIILSRMTYPFEEQVSDTGSYAYGCATCFDNCELLATPAVQIDKSFYCQATAGDT